MTPKTQSRADGGERARIGMAGKAMVYVSLVVGVLGTLLTLGSLLSQERLTRRALEQHAAALASLTAESCGEALERLDVGVLRSILHTASVQEGITCVYVTDRDHRVITDGTDANPRRGTRLAPEARDSCTPGAAPILASHPVRNDRELLGYVRIGVSPDASAAELAAMRWRSIAIAGLFLIGAMIVAALVGRRLLQPLEDLCAATRAVATGNFDIRVPIVRADEIGLLATSFNAMAETLEATTVSRDELARINEALESARVQAVASTRAKSEFLANMSHEIRTPMTAILGYAELLLEASSSTEDREAASTILENGRHLLGVLDDILDLSKVEAGRMTIEKIGCSPARLAREVLDLMSVRAREKRLDLQLHVREPVPASIESDPTRIRQVLVNLIGNAVKFTPAGTVSLTVESTEDAHVAFAVEDTGIGMNPHEVSRLFEPFSQADECTTRRFGGTGLGLTISRRLVELMNGTIDVRSTVGEGSRFVVRIPVGSVSATSSPAHAAKPEGVDGLPTLAAGDEDPLRGARILLAEDGRDNQRLLSRLLDRYGAEVVVVQDGRAALELTAPSETGAPQFDLVLMDMQMPEMDGYTATARLRERGFDRPIVALTAHAMAGDRQRCIDAGCDDYATKPIQRERLVAIIRSCLRNRATA